MRLHTRAAVGLTAALTFGALAMTPALAAKPQSTALATTPNDTYWSRQWGPVQVHAPQAWSTSTGSGVLVGIVDAGIDLDQPDLKGKVVSGATFLDCAGAGSCGNGDWESGPAVRKATKSPHGTHVAGTVGAVTNNGLGVAAVAPAAKVLAVKVLDEDGGSFADIGKGIRYATDHGVKVINLSLGALPGVQALTFTGVISDVQDAITYATNRGVTVVAAAGNDTFPVCGTPAFDKGAVCVTATDKREAPSYYTNGAIKPGLTSVAAPGGSGLSSSKTCGEDVVSTVPIGAGTFTSCGYTKNYDEYAGTSMATPHVSGVAALLAAQGRSRDNVVSALLATARTPGSVARGVFTPEYGYGIVDAKAAVAYPKTG